MSVGRRSGQLDQIEEIPYAPAWDGDEEDRCAVWTAYARGGERLKVWIGKEVRELYRANAISGPAIAQTGPGCWQVAAPTWAGGRWSCPRYEVTPAGARELADLPLRDALPGSARLFQTPGGLVAALAVARAGRYSIRVLRCGRDETQPLFSTPVTLQCQRPALAALGPDAVLAYDAWHGEAYHVFVQRGNTVLRVSGDGGWHLSPDVVADVECRLWLAWVRTSDVVNPQGVLDSRCEIMLALLLPKPGGGWEVHPFGAIEDLSHGLLDCAPEPRGVWGYLGRRRHPMLLRTPSGVELLWEQKEFHEEGTLKNTGVLWARRLSVTGLGSPRPLARGALWYEVPASRCVGSDRFALCCFQGIDPEPRRVSFCRVEETVAAAPRLPPEMWRAWKPVTLPMSGMFVEERPLVVVGDRKYHLYWLDLHCHTTLSADAEGEMDECYRTARYKALLDGVLMSDNDYLYGVALAEHEWRTNCEAAEAFNEPGYFVALVGYEWTARPTVCGKAVPEHRTVLLPGPTSTIARWNEVGAEPSALCDFLRQHRGLAHAHHQAWSLCDDKVEVNIEAASSWETYLERDPSHYHRHLRQGMRIGVIGGSDEHRRNPGLGGALTGVWSEELTRESILSALRAHRCYATTGRRIVVDFRANGRFMGETAAGPGVRFHICIASPAPLAAIEIIRDGEVSHRWDAGGALRLDLEHEERVGAGLHFFYLKVIVEGRWPDRAVLPANLQPALGNLAWSSPIWVES